MTPAEAIEAAELAEAETRYRLQLAREAYQAGYAQAEADMAARWARIAAPVVRGVPHAELEERRWGPGGRAALQEAEAGQPEPEPELEAGP